MGTLNIKIDKKQIKEVQQGYNFGNPRSGETRESVNNKYSGDFLVKLENPH